MMIDYPSGKSKMEELGLKSINITVMRQNWYSHGCDALKTVNKIILTLKVKALAVLVMLVMRHGKGKLEEESQKHWNKL